MGGPSCKKEKARGFSVNLKFPIILGLKCKSIQHESCATFQDLQLLYCAKIPLVKGFEIILESVKTFICK